MNEIWYNTLKTHFNWYIGRQISCLYNYDCVKAKVNAENCTQLNHLGIHKTYKPTHKHVSGNY